MELVVRQALAEVAAGSRQGVQKAIAGIVHAIGAEDGFEAAFIEAGVVCNEGNIGRKNIRFKGRQDAVFHLVPDVREQRRVLGVIRPQAMDLLAEPGVVVRVRVDEAVEEVHHFPIAHDDYAHGAHTAGATVGGFEIYDDCVGQISVFLYQTGRRLLWPS